MKGASAIEFLFCFFFEKFKFCGLLDKVIQIFSLSSNIPCTCGFYFMKSEYNFSTISKAIEINVYVFEKKLWMFIFLCILLDLLYSTK